MLPHVQNVTTCNSGPASTKGGVNQPPAANQPHVAWAANQTPGDQSGGERGQRPSARELEGAGRCALRAALIKRYEAGMMSLQDVRDIIGEVDVAVLGGAVEGLDVSTSRASAQFDAYIGGDELGEPTAAEIEAEGYEPIYEEMDVAPPSAAGEAGDDVAPEAAGDDANLGDDEAEPAAQPRSSTPNKHQRRKLRKGVDPQAVKGGMHKKQAPTQCKIYAHQQEFYCLDCKHTLCLCKTDFQTPIAYATSKANNDNNQDYNNVYKKGEIQAMVHELNQNPERATNPNGRPDARKLQGPNESAPKSHVGYANFQNQVLTTCVAQSKEQVPRQANVPTCVIQKQFDIPRPKGCTVGPEILANNQQFTNFENTNVSKVCKQSVCDVEKRPQFKQLEAACGGKNNPLYAHLSRTLEIQEFLKGKIDVALENSNLYSLTHYSDLLEKSTNQLLQQFQEHQLDMQFFPVGYPNGRPPYLNVSQNRLKRIGMQQYLRSKNAPPIFEMPKKAGGTKKPKPNSGGQQGGGQQGGGSSKNQEQNQGQDESTNQGNQEGGGQNGGQNGDPNDDPNDNPNGNNGKPNGNDQEDQGEDPPPPHSNKRKHGGGGDPDDPDDPDDFGGFGRGFDFNPPDPFGFNLQTPRSRPSFKLNAPEQLSGTDRTQIRPWFYKLKNYLQFQKCTDPIEQILVFRHLITGPALQWYMDIEVQHQQNVGFGLPFSDIYEIEKQMLGYFHPTGTTFEAEQKLVNFRMMDGKLRLYMTTFQEYVNQTSWSADEKRRRFIENLTSPLKSYIHEFWPDADLATIYKKLSHKEQLTAMANKRPKISHGRDTNNNVANPPAIKSMQVGQSFSGGRDQNFHRAGGPQRGRGGNNNRGGRNPGRGGPARGTPSRGGGYRGKGAPRGRGGRFGPDTRTLEQKQNDWAAYLARSTCNNCGEKGHLAQMCQKPVQGNAGTIETSKQTIDCSPACMSIQRQYKFSIAAINTQGTESIEVLGDFQGHQAKFFIDSGATHVFVNNDFVRKHKLVTQGMSQQKCELVDGSTTTMVDQLTDVSITVGELTWIQPQIFVVPNLGKHEIILGMEWHTMFNPDICYKNRTVHVTVAGIKYSLTTENNTKIPKFTSSPEEPIPAAHVLGINSEPNTRSWLTCAEVEKIYKEDQISHIGFLKIEEQPGISINSIGLSEIPADTMSTEKEKIYKKYDHIFRAPSGVPKHRPFQHSIDLEPDATPVKRQPYRLSNHELEELKKQIQELQDKGWIQPSTSPYGAPIMFVKKKDGRLQIVVDYRKLNEQTIKNAYPIPHIDDLLRQLSGAKYFTTIDLGRAYHQIPLKPEDTWKTAFNTRLGSFEYLVMPFGLTNAPATFQAAMNQTFSDMIDKFLVLYLDDILIFSKTWEEHLQHVHQVFDRLLEHDWCVTKAKCQFFETQVEYLGHIVSEKGIQLNHSKLQPIFDFPQPTTIVQMQSFLGMCNFFRKFIHQFSRIALPLYRLTKQNQPWVWTDECEYAFSELKQALTQAPILMHPTTTDPFCVVTDASQAAIGGVLMQLQNVDWVVIAYYSKSMAPAERNYSVYDKEFLAVVKCVQHWRQYLHAQTFTVYVDHKPLEYLYKQSQFSDRQIRWTQKLDAVSTEISIQAIKGSENVIADALSRINSLEIVDMQSTATIIKFSQEQDQFCQQILKGEKQIPGYTIKNGKVEFQGKIFIPDSNAVKWRLMQDVHDSTTGSHKGADKCYAELSQHVTWPNMKKDIQSYCRSCPTCQAEKARTQKVQVPLQPHDVPNKPWDHFSMDFFSGFPKVKQFDACLIVVDKLTKMTKLIPTAKSVKAAGTADLLHDNIFRSFGLPTKIISDRDPRFTSKFWKNIFKRLKVKLNLSTAYHPQTDGQSERNIRTVGDMLRCMCTDYPTKWVEMLPMIEFAFNNSIHRATNMTPFAACYGWQPNTPLSINLQKTCGDTDSTSQSISWLKRLADIKEVITKYTKRMEQWYNSNAIKLSYDVGDRVMLNANDLVFANKHLRFNPRFIGPFRIIAKVTENAYKLALPGHMHRIHDTFNIRKLYAFFEDSRWPREYRRPPPIVFEGEERYLVEKILSKRGVGRNRQYLIKWEGYPASENTWEPTHYIHPELLEFYEKQGIPTEQEQPEIE